MNILKSGFIPGEFVPDLFDYDEEENSIRYPENGTYTTLFQSLFSHPYLSALRAAIFSVLVSCGSECGRQEVSDAKMPLSFELQFRCDGCGE